MIDSQFVTLRTLASLNAVFASRLTLIRRRRLIVIKLRGVITPETSETVILGQLRKVYERSFKAYMKACREGYALLAAVRDLPASEGAEAEMLAQRRREVEVHTAYTGARTKLWKLLIAKPALPTQGSVAEPLESDPSSTSSA